MSFMPLLLVSAVLATGPDPISGPHSVLGTENLQYSIEPTVVIEEFDGKSCWFHPRGGVIPAESSGGDAPVVVMTMQKWFVSVSDYFSGISYLQSEDMGKSWSEVSTPNALALRQEDDKTT